MGATTAMGVNLQPMGSPTSVWRKVTATKLIVGLCAFIILTEGLHLHMLGATRNRARVALAGALHGVATADAQTITATLDAFDRMTADIFFATTGPYLVLAILIPSLVVSLIRLQNNLSATEKALKRILMNNNARTHDPATPSNRIKIDTRNNGS